MKAADLVLELDKYPAKMPMMVNGFPVIAIEVARGRIRRDAMFTRFSEMPDKPRDEALVMRFTEGKAMTVAEVRKAIEVHGDLEVFVWDEPVSGIRCVRALYDWTNRKYVRADTNEMVATPVRWIELSDGTQDHTSTWIKPKPAFISHEC